MSCQKKVMWWWIYTHFLSALCLCSELQLLFHSQKSPWWLEFRLPVTDQSQMCVLPGGATSDSSCNHSYFRNAGNPIINRKPTYTQPALLGRTSSSAPFPCSLYHLPTELRSLLFLPRLSHTHCSAKLIQLSVCQYAATVPFGPTGVLLISHSWAAC